jgi:nucleoside phosphorylase/CheY-like chemotaxis protein
VRILIADDCKSRYKNLLPKLADLGVDRTSVTLVGSADEAQTALESQYFDLLVLDIIIPLFDTDDEGSHEHSLAILYRINHDDSIVKPGKVIGITADLSAAGAAQDTFSDSTWSIISYSQIDNEWQQRIINCVQYILGEKQARPVEITKPAHLDIVLLCALETPEFEALMELPWNWAPSRPIHDHMFVRDGWFLSKGEKITVAAAFASRMGMVETAIKSSIAISQLCPSLIAMTGICAGVSTKSQFGDVIFAEFAWDFQSGKMVKDGEVTKRLISPHQIPATYAIKTLMEVLRSDKEFLNSLPSLFSESCPFSTKIKIGPVASGSSVLADGDIIKEIQQQQQRDLFGVEMEIYGLYAAAYASSPPVRFFALKGVCDHADPDKDDEAQRYAAYASARVLQKLFEEHGMTCVGNAK